MAWCLVAWSAGNSAMLFSMLDKLSLNQRSMAHSGITEPWELEETYRSLTGRGGIPTLPHLELLWPECWNCGQG